MWRAGLHLLGIAVDDAHDLLGGSVLDQRREVAQAGQQHPYLAHLSSQRNFAGEYLIPDLPGSIFAVGFLLKQYVFKGFPPCLVTTGPINLIFGLYWTRFYFGLRGAPHSGREGKTVGDTGAPLQPTKKNEKC